MSAQLEITRYFSKSKEEVYQAFTTAESLKQWWGPTGFEMEVKTFEFYPEGRVHFVLKNKEGYKMWAKWIIQEIEESSKLQFINSFSNEAGETVKAPEVPFGPNWPMEMIVDLEFYEEAGKTRIDLVSLAHNASEASKQVFEENICNMEQGFGGTFDQLENYLSK
ncbi:SRPBCC domain-containing protein [Algoriphagus halophytocola]|uniref:SRPBCC domain-containing protein n=1 Tax=Algoriphagus halophytocola TaxID=2991499 RepID=A0ABY6MKC2_9BACT|nr:MULTISPECIES: SRPBCC domain-containing protein [unclassified Algoriphagus]UZD23623.1 SRPBCC domain-containing protein [Algoriphagus sp. TR-M5]WBL44916.1 SRPBCC domain-containing protein [Algoriphagus sp. TR-M9]